MNEMAEMINSLAKMYNARYYLEIGVRFGATFFDVSIQHKTGIDPNFVFDINKYKNDKDINLFSLTSDEFFTEIISDYRKFYTNEIKYDIIFIDGLHTFQQAMNDFINSLKFSHDNTIWIFDDTVPSDFFSSLPDNAKNLKYRTLAGYNNRNYHGDVYKCLFNLYNFYPDFSFSTVIDVGNPFTVVWKTHAPAIRQRLQNSLSEINNLTYIDFLDYCYIINPTKRENLLYKFGKHFEIIDMNIENILPLVLKNQFMI